MYPHRSCRIPLPTKQETHVLVSCLTRMNDALPLSYRPEEDNCLGGNRSSKQLSRVVVIRGVCSGNNPETTTSNDLAHLFRNTSLPWVKDTPEVSVMQ